MTTVNVPYMQCNLTHEVKVNKSERFGETSYVRISGIKICRDRKGIWLLIYYNNKSLINC